MDAVVGLDQIRSDWATLGAEDPLWAVLAEPGARHGGWRPEEFLATGRREIATVLALVAELRPDVPRRRALDFGCGAGRLTIALAEHVEDVVGVDISPAMLAKARELDAGHRCTFVHNDRADLAAFADGHFDLAVSSLVLQHLPRTLAAGYLRELLRVLSPGGVLVIELAERPDLSPRGILTRLLPRRVMRLLQRRVLRYPAPMDMHPMRRRALERIVGPAGGRVLRRDDGATSGGGHWHYARYVIGRD